MSTATPAAAASEAALLDQQGRVPEAIAAYTRLLAKWPGLPNCWYNLGVLQRRAGQFPQALSSYAEALQRGVVQPEEVHLNRGVIFSDCLHQPQAAEFELSQALALNPTYVPALINLANLHEDLGRREAAAAVYERILALAPEAPQVLARYAGLKNFSNLDDPLIARLRRAAAYPGTPLADRACVEFALGRALDGCHAFDAAFAVYRAANRHSRAGAAGVPGYDPKRQEEWVDSVIEAFDSSAPQPLTTDGPLADSGRLAPIFICGMFRSGSTLVEQVLAGHPCVRAGGELDLLPRLVRDTLTPFPDSMATATQERLRAVAADYSKALRGLFPEATHVTDKRLDNLIYIGLIKRLFPAAKIVHTTRDPLDNCLSIFFLHLDPAMSYALDLMDTGHYYRQYLRLMAHWKALFGADIIDVGYDALVRDPVSVVKELLAFLGLDWDDRCLRVAPSGRAVRTASVWQVREPIYQRSSGRARHYGRHLDALREYLAAEGRTPPVVGQ